MVLYDLQKSSGAALLEGFEVILQRSNKVKFLWEGESFFPFPFPFLFSFAIFPLFNFYFTKIRTLFSVFPHLSP